MNVIINDLPYINPCKFFFHIHKLPFSFYMDAFCKRTERYTVCGFSPFLIFKSKKDYIEIEENGKVNKFKGNVLEEFQRIFHHFKINSDLFFSPGGFGFLSYDFAWQIEDLPDISIDDLNIPDIFVCFYDSLFLFDNLKRKSFLISFNHKPKEKEIVKSIIEEKSKFKDKLSEFKFENLTSNTPYFRYEESIKKIKDYIKEGDVYQINFSHRFQIKGKFEPYSLFYRLKKTNPSPYSAYFNLIDFILISNSPEVFLRKHGNKILTKPMKGTRRPTENRNLNKKIADDLLKSEKDRAELIMIVDLERNDLGKICKYGTVRVKKLINLEKYKTVYQTTSTIEGELNENINLKEIIKATFPGGSVTGAPKKRAMEIIEELEVNKRSFYTGSFGYFGFNGNLQLNILIRSLIMKNDKIYYPVGGGIVWDSIPEEEYKETITKARNLFLTIGIKEDEIRNFDI